VERDGMSIGPDLAGFDNAQRALVQNFGRDVRFYGPADVVYDPATPVGSFDLEGIPLDPLASGVSNEDTTLPIAGLQLVGSAHCNVVYKPLQTSLLRRDQTMETPLAIRSGLNRDLILNIEDAAQVTNASHFWIGTLNADGSWTAMDNEMVKISDTKTDTFGSVERFIVYGQDTE
jgi:hypothetical protein